MQRKPRDAGSMRGPDCKLHETTRSNGLRELVRVCLDFAKAGYNGDFPDRSGQYVNLVCGFEDVAGRRLEQG